MPVFIKLDDIDGEAVRKDSGEAHLDYLTITMTDAGGDTLDLKTSGDGGAVSGDYNADGTVDGQDFLVWQRQVGTGDVNGDGLVDAADYTVWRDNFRVDHEDEIDFHDISWVL